MMTCRNMMLIFRSESHDREEESLTAQEIKGQCLCGTVKYRFTAEELMAYQCHCSICRKSNGTAFSTMIFAEEPHFSWLCGQELITTYAKETGFKVQFCSQCGSPVPNQFRDYPLYSIPAGSLDHHHEIEVAAQIYLDSRANWDNDFVAGHRIAGAPNIRQMLELLHVQI